ncbi:hypothetical protein MA16_Dca007995 [Dendrobium catenatum]|uniref:Uncharacterized protein n=1 Tax=Dendrobium catenatum TaxID=906689 RepID=A0A2I0VKZ9_9ASPA|nr:hypothetical protein MA16_Dca007995 [Dendrobium catenatum]
MEQGEILDFSSRFIDYFTWTIQYINFKKSLILFCKVVSKRRRRRVNKELVLCNVDEITYLGVNMALRRLKASNFLFVLDKAM